MNETNRKLIELIISKTNQKMISWSRGSLVNEFRADLNAATLNVSRGSSQQTPFGDVEYVHLSMFNGTGNAITLAYMESSDIDFDLLDRLYLAAKDSCTKETETIDLLFQELESLGCSKN